MAQKKKQHLVEMRHIIISPSDKEIPYAASNAPKFASIVKDYIKEYYPNRRAIICIQQDGHGFTDENGKVKKILHAHVALSDCDIYEYKGVPKKCTGFKYLSETFDHFISNKYKIKIDTGRNLPKRKYREKKLVVDGSKDNNGKFLSYQDDIKDRIDRCANASISIDDFFNNLHFFGLTVKHKTRKSGDPYQTYYLNDLSNVSDTAKTSAGHIKTIAKKTQFPSMRSYKQNGYSLSDVEEKIKAKYANVIQNDLSHLSNNLKMHATNTSAIQKYSEQNTLISQQNHVTHNNNNKSLASEATSVNEQLSAKAKSQQRYQQAQKELQIDHTRTHNKQLSL